MNEIGFFVTPKAVIYGRTFERVNGDWALTSASLKAMVEEFVAEAPDDISDADAMNAGFKAAMDFQYKIKNELETEWRKSWPVNAVSMTEYASR